MTAQIAEVALNLSGIFNLLMHIFLRSNADRLAIRGADTPWSDKRTMRVFGPSDLNIRDQISYPVLWQAGDHDNNSFIAKKLEKSSTDSTTQSDYDSYSTRGPLQNAVFPSPKEKGPLTPPMKNSPGRQASQPSRNNSAYSIFPTTASAQQAHMSTSTTFSNINEEYEMPLPPPPLFAQKHDHTDSEASRQSSATVQIGLRLSYMNHALDPLETSPPSSLQQPLKPTNSIPKAGYKRPEMQRASASSDTINDFAVLPPQAYKKAVMQRQRSFPPQATQVSHIAAQISIPQQEMSAPRLELLTNAAFQRPVNQASLPGVHVKPQMAVITQDTQQPAPNDAATNSSKDAIIFTSASSVLSSAPGLPRGPKATPNWRPQNWGVAEESGSPNVSPIERVTRDENVSRKGSGGSNKNLPTVPESAQLDVSPLNSNNPWKLSKPQVIQRQPGWV